MNTLQQALLFVAILFGLSLLGAFIYHLAPVLTPFVIAAVLAYLADPLVEKLAQRAKLPRTLAVSIVFLIVILLIVIVLLFLVPALQKQIMALAAKIPHFISWLQTALMPQLAEFGIAEQDLGLDTLKSSLSENMSHAGTVAKWVWTTAFQSSKAIVEGFMNLFIICIATFYLLRDWRSILEAFKALLPSNYASPIVQIAQKCDTVLSTFVRGQLSVMAALGAYYGLGLALIGVNYSLLIGMMAGILSIVPYLGSIVGLGTALALTYFQFHTLWPVLSVLGLFGIGHILEGTVLTPLLIGDKLGLHPVVVIFAVLAGGHLLGFVGVVLAIPLTAIIVVIVNELLHRLPSAAPQKAIAASEAKQGG